MITEMEPKTQKKRKKEGQFIQVVKRLSKNKTAMFGLVLFVIIILISIFAPLLAPYNPTEMNPSAAFAKPSLEHLMGCDRMGRDQLSRLLYGGRASLSLGISAALISAVIGVILGALAGYFGGWVDLLLMRFNDVLQSIPGNLLSIVISTVLGGGFLNTILALSVGGIPGSSRMLRSRILSERQCEYLEAAESINCSKRRVIFVHLLPNTISPVIVNVTMGMGFTIMAAAGLSMIGLGIQPPNTEWGAMLSDGRQYVQSYPYLLIFPGLFIAVTILAINLLGDGLRDALDPKLKK